jgi:hypothetical protein
MFQCYQKKTSHAEIFIEKTHINTSIHQNQTHTTLVQCFYDCTLPQSSYKLSNRKSLNKKVNLVDVGVDRKLKED